MKDIISCANSIEKFHSYIFQGNLIDSKTLFFLTYLNLELQNYKILKKLNEL